MIPLTNDENESYLKQEVCHICKKEFVFDIDTCSENMYIKYHRVKDHCHYNRKYRSAAHNICNLKYKTPKEIPITFHNGSTYDYHFIIKEFAKEFDGQFECVGENTEKYITFSVPIKKRLDNDKTVTYKLKFIDSFRFMSTSLSSLVKNLSDGLYNDKCTDCKSCLYYMSAKDNQLIFTCLNCNNNRNKDLNKDLIDLLAHMNFVIKILINLFYC